MQCSMISVHITSLMLSGEVEKSFGIIAQPWHTRRPWRSKNLVLSLMLISAEVLEPSTLRLCGEYSPMIIFHSRKKVNWRSHLKAAAIKCIILAVSWLLSTFLLSSWPFSFFLLLSSKNALTSCDSCCISGLRAFVVATAIHEQEKPFRLVKRCRRPKKHLRDVIWARRSKKDKEELCNCS